ncbi:MAG: CDP-alcohol phosphatidyltransferase family protein [Vicinamibacterales bacterium]
MTAVRAALVVLLAALLFVADVSRALAWAAVVAASVAAVLDGVDGWLARRTGQTTAFGARFDMETDALLILVLSILVWQWGKAGAWVMAIGLMRYLFVAAGWVTPWMRGHLSPTRRGKTVAVWQMVTLIVCIGPIVPVWLSTAGAAFSLALLAWSFAIDVGRLWRT